MRNKEIFLIIIAFLFIVGGVFIFSHYQERLRIEGKKLKEIEEKIKIINQFQKVDKEWQEKAEKFLFSDISSFKKEVRRIAKNIRIKKWKTLSSQKDDLTFQKRERVIFYTTYENFLKFLKDLKKYPSVRIKSFSIESVDERGRLNIKLEFVAKTLR